MDFQFIILEMYFIIYVGSCYLVVFIDGDASPSLVRGPHPSESPGGLLSSHVPGMIPGSPEPAFPGAGLESLNFK